MRQSRFTNEQMVRIIRGADKDPAPDVARRHGVSQQTIYTWRKRFVGLKTDEVRRLKHLEVKDARLKKLVGEHDLEIEVMREVAAKNWRARRRGGARWSMRASV